jgi:hypothetical protein
MRLYPQLSELRSRQIVRDVLVLIALVVFLVLAVAVRRAVMSLTAVSEGFTSGASGAQDSWNDVGDSLSRIPFVGDDVQRTFADLADATFGSAAETGQAVTDAVALTANVLAFVTFAAPTVAMLVLWLPRRLDRARSWGAAHRVLSALPAPPAFVAATGAAPVGVPRAGGAPDVASAAAPGALAGTAPGALPTSGDPGGSGAAAGALPTPGEQSGVGAAPGALPGVAEGRHDTVALPWGSAALAAVGSAASPAPGASPGVAAEHPGGPVVSFPPEELLALRALCQLPFEDLVKFCPRPFETFAAGDYAPLVAALYAHEGLVPPGWSTRA